MGNGNVQGLNSTSRIAEGNDVHLTANENQDNPFVCWIKDLQVVSIESEYTFTMSESTQGTYIGLFAEKDPKFMLFTALTTAEVNIPGVTTFNIDVSISPSNDQPTKRTLYSGAVSDEASDIYNGSVFSYLNETLYSINIHLTYYFPGIDEQIEDNYTLQLADTDFIEEDEQGNKTSVNKIIVSDEQETIKLTFEKMTRVLAERTFNK